MSPANPPADRSRREGNTPQEWNSVQPRGSRAKPLAWERGSGAPASQRHARDPDPGRRGVLAPADDGLPGAPHLPGRVRREHGLDDLGADRLPRLGRGADADPRPARRPVRQGAAAADQPRALPRRLPRRRVRVEPLVADRLPGRLGRGRRALPAQLRDHPRRVPAREGEGRDRPALGGLGRRRRLRDRPLRPDRRQLLLALPLPARLDPGRPLARPRRALRAGVADPLAVEGRRAGRAAALGRADLADGRADRGRAVGLGVAAPPRRPRALRRSSSCSGASSSRARARRWSTCACSRTGRSC